MKTTDAAAFFGSKKKLADALSINPSAVTQWGEFVPEARQYQIQVLTKGRLKASRKSAANSLQPIEAEPKMSAALQRHQAPLTMLATIPATGHQYQSAVGAVNSSSTQSVTSNNQ
ncbi:Cro/CI family transcriptional regulator [Pseudomonas putida]|uniref:Cro/CI family transcriptional regulator n=1 Tax=Pseudomonas putida TaxID=303 RepID=UPI00349E6F21